MDSSIRGSVYPRGRKMEIKTIEELGRIPVENDDFAAASDQGGGRDPASVLKTTGGMPGESLERTRWQSSHRYAGSAGGDVVVGLE